MSSLGWVDCSLADRKMQPEQHFTMTDQMINNNLVCFFVLFFCYISPSGWFSCEVHTVQSYVIVTGIISRYRLQFLTFLGQEMSFKDRIVMHLGNIFFFYFPTTESQTFYSRRYSPFRAVCWTKYVKVTL